MSRQQRQRRLAWLATLSGVGPRSSGVEVDPDSFIAALQPTG
jgi:hypothetical protein